MGGNVSDPEKINASARLVERVFLKCLEARNAFSLELERCSIKGWPDRSAAIRISTRVQELFSLQLSARLTHLVRRHGSDDALWSAYTSTAKVQERLQEGWSDQEEAVLQKENGEYAQIQIKIAQLQALADPAALEEPFGMARRDPEFIAAAWKLNNTVFALDRELASGIKMEVDVK
jgi:hypothetical protein